MRDKNQILTHVVWENRASEKKNRRATFSLFMPVEPFLLVSDVKKRKFLLSTHEKSFLMKNKILEGVLYIYGWSGSKKSKKV